MDVNTPPEVPVVLSKNFFFTKRKSDLWMSAWTNFVVKRGKLFGGKKMISSVTLLDIKGTMQLIVTV